MAEESRLDDMLDTLTAAATHAVNGGTFELRTRLRAGLAEALRGTVRDQGGQQIDGERLTEEACRTSALSLLDGNLPNNPGQRETIIRVVASLLQQVREADQRERWIREGYSADARRAWRMMEEAQQRAGELAHAVRLVKRATRDVRVGRE